MVGGSGKGLREEKAHSLAIDESSFPTGLHSVSAGETNKRSKRVGIVAVPAMV